MGLLHTYSALLIACLTFAVPVAVWLRLGFVGPIPFEIEWAELRVGCNLCLFCKLAGSQHCLGLYHQQVHAHVAYGCVGLYWGVCDRSGRADGRFDPGVYPSLLHFLPDKLQFISGPSCPRS